MRSLLLLLGQLLLADGMCTCQGDPTCWCWNNCTQTLDAACGGRPRDAAKPGLDPSAACLACAGRSQAELVESGCSPDQVETFCAKRKRPAFQVFWNSPMPFCCSMPMKPVPDFVAFNITMNLGPYYPKLKNICGEGTVEKPCFNGPEIMSMYKEETGAYPEYQSGKPINGGLPQLVNLTKYVEGWRQNIIDGIPDSTGGPIVGLDWESWRPTWSENANRPGGEPDQDVDQIQSIALVKRQHPDWTDSAKIEAEAKRQFNAGAKAFYTAAFQEAQKLRPNALWGAYDTNHCGTYACSDTNYWQWTKNVQASGDRPKTNLSTTRPAAVCPVPNINDELGWLWVLIDVLEPTIYQSTNSPAVTRSIIDCSLGEARRVATMARKLRGGKRIPVVPYQEIEWNACTTDCKFLNKTALYDTLTYAALKYGIDGLYLWGGGGRECIPANCNGTGSCTADRCDKDASLGTYLNTILGPAVKGAVTLASLCSDTWCGGHGRCWDCPEPFGPVSFGQCKCDCDDGFPGCAKSKMMMANGTAAPNVT